MAVITELLTNYFMHDGEETFKQEKQKIILDNILNSSIFNLA